MNELQSQRCIPCTKGTPPLTQDQIEPLKKQLKDIWKVIDTTSLVAEFHFKNFKEALAFTNKVGELAEQEGHHPDITLGWGRVEISLMTHKIKGLSQSDFVLAAKIDAL